MVEGLPEDTVAAFGLGLEEGWAQALLDYFAETSGADEADVDELLAEAESETGLALPEDLETLLGEGVAVGLGSGIDPDAIVNGGPAELPPASRSRVTPRRSRPSWTRSRSWSARRWRPTSR